MPRAALFMGPMARRRKVDEKYHPNSYRVISQDAEKWFMPPPQTSSAKPAPEYNLIGQHMELKSESEYRHNRPNPNQVNFLRQDVRLLNEPVCDVHTSNTKAEQHVWWNHSPSKETPSKPQHTLDTTVRDDFQYRGAGLSGIGRHSSNPNTSPTLGAVPVTMMKKGDGKQRILKEGISYEHQYNCRLDPSYPVRAKRHGSFVWDEMHPRQVDKMLHHYGFQADRSEPSVGNSTAEVCDDHRQPAPCPPEVIKTTTIPSLPPIGAL